MVGVQVEHGLNPVGLNLLTEPLRNWTGAPGSPTCPGLPWERTWAENDMFRLLFLADRLRKSYGGLPPDFLWSLVALANFMRLSLLKAAHANLFGATCRKSGSPVFFGPGTLPRQAGAGWRTWGTRPVPNGFCSETS